MSNIYCSLIDFATPTFDTNLDLRDRILRKPLNMVFTEDQISDEWDSFHFGIFISEKLVGTLILKPINRGTVKMRQVAVDDIVQGQGIGGMLVHYSEVWAKSKGFKLIELNARETAKKFYENLDYITIGEVFIEVGLNHYKMTKKIV